MKKRKYTLKQKLYLECALKIMFQKNLDAGSIQSVSEQSNHAAAEIESLFTSDDQLRLEAMEYAAYVWIDQIRAKLKDQQDKREKLRSLLSHFAGGTETYPESLSLYVDAWSILRNGHPERRSMVREYLTRIYQSYVDLFLEVIREEFDNHKTNQKTEKLLAWIFVVISDGFHVQKLIAEENFNFSAIGDVLLEMVESQLL